MLKKHLVVLLLMVMAVGVYAQSIPSGTGRIEALGNSPFILDAATDIYNNPVWTSYYRNYAFGDIGRDVVPSGESGTNDFQLTNQYVGVSFGISKKLSLGLILNKRHDSWNDYNTQLSGSGFNPGNREPVVPTTILIGYSLSKDFYVGLAPYISMWSNDSVNATFEDKASSNSIGASLGIMKMMKKGWVEGVVDFRLNSFKRDITNTGTTDSWKSEGGMQLGVSLRAWIYPKSSSKIAVVPLLGFHIYSWDPRYTHSGGTALDTIGTKFSEMGFNGGVGLNWPISDDIQIAGGIGAIYNTFKAELGTSTGKLTDFIAPTFNFAGETRIADWLTGRFGYSRGIDMSKSEFTAGTVTSSNSQTNGTPDDQTVSLGAGFHFGRFSIDATVSERWLKEGINFVSGKQNAVFGVVSASYNFSSGK